MIDNSTCFRNLLNFNPATYYKFTVCLDAPNSCQFVFPTPQKVKTWRIQDETAYEVYLLEMQSIARSIQGKICVEVYPYQTDSLYKSIESLCKCWDCNHSVGEINSSFLNAIEVSERRADRLISYYSFCLYTKDTNKLNMLLTLLREELAKAGEHIYAELSDEQKQKIEGQIYIFNIKRGYQILVPNVFPLYIDGIGKIYNLVKENFFGAKANKLLEKDELSIDGWAEPEYNLVICDYSE